MRRFDAVMHMGTRGGIQPVALGARAFLSLETKILAVADDRMGRGPKDALGAAVGPDREEMCVAGHCGDPP